ncbi:DUF167 domain-containing protein [Candidatus Margulisiibacteriota bacterium]
MEIIEEKSAVLFQVKVQPKSSVNKVVGQEGGKLKVRITSPPVEGKVNSALVDLLAVFFGVKRSSIGIVKGLKSRSKIVRVEGLSREDLTERIGTI